MTGEQFISVYIRGSNIYVAPRAGGRGLRFDIEPVRISARDKSQLVSVLRETLRFEPPLIGPNVNLRTYQSPVVAASGAKNRSQFERDAVYFEITTTPERIDLQKYRRTSGRGGFEVDGPPVVFDIACPIEDIALAILK